jgi:hypothetical protein
VSPIKEREGSTLGQSRTVWLKAGKRHWAPGRKGLSRRAIDKSTQEYSDLWYAHVADAEIEALGCWTELQGSDFLIRHMLGRLPG